MTRILLAVALGVVGVWVLGALVVLESLVFAHLAMAVERWRWPTADYPDSLEDLLGRTVMVGYLFSVFGPLWPAWILAGAVEAVLNRRARRLTV